EQSLDVYDYSLVAIHPFDSLEIERDGSIRLKNVTFGITDDYTSFVTDTNNLGLIYDIGGGNTTGFDINEGVIPSVRDSDMQSLFRKDNQSAVRSEEHTSELQSRF